VVGGAEALDIARREKPDLIILDIMLPKLSGFEVCVYPRESPARLGAILRRADASRVQAASEPKILTIGNSEIDVGRHRAPHRGSRLDLTPNNVNHSLGLSQRSVIVPDCLAE
jgi:DNA-binding response OmpR family regulator